MLISDLLQSEVPLVALILSSSFDTCVIFLVRSSTVYMKAFWGAVFYLLVLCAWSGGGRSGSGSFSLGSDFPIAGLTNATSRVSLKVIKQHIEPLTGLSFYSCWDSQGSILVRSRPL